MKITIIIPTYNEAENLPKLTPALLGLPLDIKLLIVDDGSPDGTGRLAEALGEEYPGRIHVIHRQGKLGLGTAYITGFRYALQTDTDIIGQMDADFSHPVDKIPALIAAIDTCDIAIGSRYVPGGQLDEQWPFWRKALSGFGNWYARTILRLPIRDVTGGFRFWRREVLEAIPLERVRSNGYAFQVETIYLAAKLGFQADEIPIYFAERNFGQSKMSLRIQFEAALRCWQMLGEYRDL